MITSGRTREALQTANRLDSYAAFLEAVPRMPKVFPAVLRRMARSARRRAARAPEAS